MSFWGFVQLVLIVGAVSVGFALLITLIVHLVAWIFTLGRWTAKRHPWKSPRP